MQLNTQSFIIKYRFLSDNVHEKSNNSGRELIKSKCRL